MSAAAEQGSEVLREASRALAPRARCDGGMAVSGSTVAALAELFRLIARDGDAVTDVAVRAARRLLADLERPVTPTAPAPRAPAASGGGVLAAR